MSDATIWALRGPSRKSNGETYKEGRIEIAKSIKEEKKSRFGWSWKNEHNLNEPWSDCHLRQQFLLLIKAGDWVVHINVPEQELCVAAKVTGIYGFDGGCLGDFRHYFPVDSSSIRQFNRKTEAPQALHFELGLITEDSYTQQRAWKIIKAKDLLDFLESLPSVQ